MELLDGLETQKNDAVLFTIQQSSENFSRMFKKLVPNGHAQLTMKTSESKSVPIKNVSDCEVSHKLTFSECSMVLFCNLILICLWTTLSPRHVPIYCVIHIISILCTSSNHQSWAFKEVLEGFSQSLTFIWCQNPKCVWQNSVLLLILWWCVYAQGHIGHMCRRN